MAAPEGRATQPQQPLTDGSRDGNATVPTFCTDDPEKCRAIRAECGNRSRSTQIRMHGQPLPRLPPGPPRTQGIRAPCDAVDKYSDFATQYSLYGGSDKDISKRIAAVLAKTNRFSPSGRLAAGQCVAKSEYLSTSEKRSQPMACISAGRRGLASRQRPDTQSRRFPLFVLSSHPIAGAAPRTAARASGQRAEDRTTNRTAICSAGAQTRRPARTVPANQADVHASEQATGPAPTRRVNMQPHDGATEQPRRPAHGSC